MRSGEFSAVEVAGADVVGEDGVGVVVPVVEEELLASSPSVVVPDEDELPTSAETGFCPISSIPVTTAIATSLIRPKARACAITDSGSKNGFGSIAVAASRVAS